MLCATTVFSNGKTTVKKKIRFGVHNNIAECVVWVIQFLHRGQADFTIPTTSTRIVLYDTDKPPPHDIFDHGTVIKSGPPFNL